MNFLIPLIIFTPVLMSLILMSPLIPNEEKILRKTAKGFALFHFTITVIFSAFFDFTQGDFTIETDYNWINVLGINANFTFDSLSLLLTVLTSFIFTIAIYISKNMIKKSYRLYYSLILFLLTAVIGVFTAQDLFLFFLFWELELFPMYILISKWGSGNKQKTAMKFLLYTFTGSIFLLIAFLLMYYLNLQLNGVLSSTIQDIDISEFSQELRTIIFVLLFVGFGVKLPIFPVHGWLSDTHSQAPTPVSVILSSILLKLGSFGIIKFNLQMFNDEFSIYANIIVILAVINIVYSSICAIIQKDLKRIIAYSGIANMGIFLLGIASLNSTGTVGGIFQLFSHALISAGLFIITGLIYIKCGTKNILRIQGLGEKMPRLMSISIPILLASIGIPFLCGFIAEFLTFTGAFFVENNKIPTLLALTVIILSSLYILKIFHGVFFNTPIKKVSDINTKQLIILCILTLCILVLGAFPSILTDIINQYSITNLNLAGVF